MTPSLDDRKSPIPLRPYAWRLGVVVGLLTLLAASNMALPFAIKLLIDDVFPSGADTGDWTLLWLILPGLALVYIVRNILFYTSRMMAVRVGEDSCFALRSRLYEHLQRQSLSFHRRGQAGALGSRVMDDTFKLQSFIQERLPILLLNALMLFILCVIIYAVSWKLALVSTLVLPFHLATWRHFRANIKQSQSQAQDTAASAYGGLVERFLGMEVVKGFTAERREADSFDHAIDASRQSHIRSHRYHFAQKVAADLLTGLGVITLLAAGAWQVVRGDMSVGAFFMFFGYVMLLYPTVLELLSGASHLARASASLERILEVFAHTPADECALAEDADEAAPIEGRIDVESIDFTYDGEHQVLRKCSFSVEAGEHVAILGPSGSGKTTLASLFPRFNTPTSGRIRIDGRDIRDIPLTALRSAIGVAFQEVFLFNTSILENLLYANPDATFEEVRETCALVGADEPIRRLPRGYHTRPTELTGELSRGEKQRITLARALLKDPKILILDEATASLDRPSSHQVISSILEAMQGRTVLMITHETDLAPLAHRAIHLENGAAVPDGAPRPPFRRHDSHRPKGDRSSSSGRLLPAILLSLLASLSVGCVSEIESSSGAITLEEPRASSGVVATEEDAEEFERLVAAVESANPKKPTPLTQPDRKPVVADGLRIDDIRAFLADIGQPQAAPAPDRPAAASPVEDFAAAIDMAEFPDDAGQIIPLTRLSVTELEELVDTLTLSFQAELSYARAGSVVADFLPPLPEGVARDETLARSTPDGMRLVRIGYRRFLSQPAQLWIDGYIITPDDVLVNEDLAAAEPLVQSALEGVASMREELPLADLEAQIIQLSFVDAEAALSAMKGLGVTVVDNPSQMPALSSFEQLPIVTTMPKPNAQATGLVGGDTGAQVTRNQFGLSIIPSVASPLQQETVAGPLAQLLVLHHPAHPEQHSRVLRLLEDLIDVPARQVFIEGMVLEISEDGLEELGIEWEFQEGDLRTAIGTLMPGVTDRTLDLVAQESQSLAQDWAVKIRALVREGKAEILSRPSVLTIDNRQATIRVGDDIPIATSQEGLGGGASKISFDFRYIPTGILLNVRPRIDAEDEEISMQIDTTVSAVVPGADLEVRDSEGVLLASAPTISSRRVQTYARIANNTPFIIGGLVSRDRTLTTDKVPVLGDLPLLGRLFRASREETSKREVIIVLTPYVLPEEQRIGRADPKTDEQFDSFGTELFRDAYRLREEEVFDLAFLTENRRLTLYKDLANRVIRQNFRIAERRPFSLFAGDRIPGENILVHRMIYEVIKSLDLAEKVLSARVIYFEPDPSAGYRVRFVSDLLMQIAEAAGAAPSETLDSFFEGNRNKALYLTYMYDRESLRPGAFSDEPVPDVGLIDCPDRETWGRLLWELNQPLPSGEQRFTILIKDREDLLRLRRAIILKRMVQLNGGEPALTLRNFSVGKMLQTPELEPDAIHVVDADVARYFFHTEHYYPSVTRVIEGAIADLDRALRAPELRPYLSGAELPEPAREE